MRRSPFDARRSATVILLFSLVAAFIAQSALGRFSHFPVNAYLALSVDGLRHGYVWQLLSFQFLHGGIIHLLLNCWAIFVFGREIEEALGPKRFLTLYFLSGTVGGLVQALFGVLLGGWFAAPVVGASAGGFGLIAAFAALYPERQLTLLIFFIIPVTLRAKFLLLFCALAGVFGIIFPGGNVAHAAHLGGMLTGIVFIRYAPYWRWPQLSRQPSQPVRRMAKVVSPKTAFWGRTKEAAEEEVPADEFLRKEVDPILDKISAHGIQSLTERERRILESARARMAKR